MKLHALGFVVLLVVADSATAQSAVYRCGNEYTRTPCTQGKVIDTQNSARSAAQREEAAGVAAAERRLADDMARERRLAEAAIKPASAGSLGPAKPATPPTKTLAASKAKKKKGVKNAEGEDFVASVQKAKT